MSNFNEALRGLDAVIAADSYGKWGRFSDDAAKLIRYAAITFRIAPELVAVTWLNESVFKFYPEPNMNGVPENFEKWDVGSMQMNVYWTKADIAKAWYRLPPGMTLFDALGSRQFVHFNGNPLANISLASVKLLRLDKSDDAVRAVKYTAPAARDYRLKSYNKYAPLFRDFFTRYDPNK